MANGKAGAPKGNTNAARGKRWNHAIDRALTKYEKEGVVAQGQALEAIAIKMIDMALEGDSFAIKELGDRLDGKATQPLSSDEENPLNVYSRIVIEHVNSSDS